MSIVELSCPGCHEKLRINFMVKHEVIPVETTVIYRHAKKASALWQKPKNINTKNNNSNKKKVKKQRSR